MITTVMVDDLIVRGEDDWVTAAEVAWVARSVGMASTDHEIRRLALELIRYVLEQHLMETGDVTDGGFFAWDLSPQESLDRVATLWPEHGPPPDLGEIGWLANTTAGTHRARSHGAGGGSEGR